MDQRRMYPTVSKGDSEAANQQHPDQSNPPQVSHYQGSIMLQLSNVNTYYGPSHVLQDISLEVNTGEIVCLLGANAAGKTTTMKTIFGLVRAKSGSIAFDGQPIGRQGTDEIVKSGLVLVPRLAVYSHACLCWKISKWAFM